MSTLRRGLDAVYSAAAVLAALCLVAILVAICVQMTSRWLGNPVQGASDYAGYLMAAASFLAFPAALNAGAHIRVSLLLNALGKARFWLELWCLGIATAATVYLAWYAVRMVYWSWRLGDVSQGQDATPLWIAQAPLAVGAVLFAICVADNLASLLIRGRDNIGSDSADQSHGE